MAPNQALKRLLQQTCDEIGDRIEKAWGSAVKVYAGPNCTPQISNRQVGIWISSLDEDDTDAVVDDVTYFNVLLFSKIKSSVQFRNPKSTLHQLRTASNPKSVRKLLSADLGALPLPNGAQVMFGYADPSIDPSDVFGCPGDGPYPGGIAVHLLVKLPRGNYN